MIVTTYPREYIGEGGRGYNIDVWLDPAAADPQIRAETVNLLNSLELTPTE